MTEYAEYGENPFKPGFGAEGEAPYLAGRGPQVEQWGRRLGKMQGADADAKPKGGLLLMYGPRGMGKTALLDRPASIEAIRIPLQDKAWRPATGELLAVADEALDYLADDAQGYPFFLQLWGHGLWEHAVRYRKAQLHLADAMMVKKIVQQDRAAFYEERGQELRRGFLPEAANAVAQTFAAAAEAGLLSANTAQLAIESALEDDIPHKGERRDCAADMLTRLQHLGFCWRRPGEAKLTAGIPSYMEHAMEMYKEREQGMAPGR